MSGDPLGTLPKTRIGGTPPLEGLGGAPPVEVKKEQPGQVESGGDQYEGLSNREVLSTHRVNQAAQKAIQQSQTEDPFLWIRPNTEWTFADLDRAFQQLDQIYARASGEKRKELLKQLSQAINGSGDDYHTAKGDQRLRNANAKVLLTYLALSDHRLGFADVARQLVSEGLEAERIGVGWEISRRYVNADVWTRYVASDEVDQLTGQGFVENVQRGRTFRETNLKNEIDGASAEEYASTGKGHRLDLWRNAEAYASLVIRDPAQLERLKQIRRYRHAIQEHQLSSPGWNGLGLYDRHDLRHLGEHCKHIVDQFAQGKSYGDRWELVFDINRVPPMAREVLQQQFRQRFEQTAKDGGTAYEYWGTTFVLEDLAQRAHELSPDKLDALVEQILPALEVAIRGHAVTDYCPPLARIGERSPRLQQWLDDLQRRIPEMVAAREREIAEKKANGEEVRWVPDFAAQVSTNLDWIRAVTGQLGEASDAELDQAYGQIFSLYHKAKGDQLYFVGASSLLKHAENEGAKRRLLREFTEFEAADNGLPILLEMPGDGDRARANRRPGLKELALFTAVAKHSEQLTLEEIQQAAPEALRPMIAEIWSRLDQVKIAAFEQVIDSPEVLRHELKFGRSRHTEAITELATELFELPLPGQRSLQVLHDQWSHFVDYRLSLLADRLEEAGVARGSPEAVAYERMFDAAAAMAEAVEAAWKGQAELDLTALPEELLAAGDKLLALKNDWCTLTVVDSTTFGHDLGYAQYKELITDLGEIDEIVRHGVVPPKPKPKDAPVVQQAPLPKGPPPKPVVDLTPPKAFSLSEPAGDSTTPLMHLSQAPKGQARFLADALGTFRLQGQWHQNDQVVQELVAQLAPPSPKEPVIDVAIASFREGGPVQLPSPIGSAGRAGSRTTADWPLVVGDTKDAVEPTGVLGYSFQAQTGRNAHLDATRDQYLHAISQLLSKSQYEALTRVPLATDPPWKVADFIDRLEEKLGAGLSLHGLLIEIFTFVNQNYGGATAGEVIEGSDWPKDSNELSLLILRRLDIATAMAHGYITETDTISAKNKKHWLVLVAPDQEGHGLALFNGFFAPLGDNAVVGAPVGLEDAPKSSPDVLGEEGGANGEEGGANGEEEAKGAEDAGKTPPAEEEKKEQELQKKGESLIEAAENLERIDLGTALGKPSGTLWQRAMQALKELFTLGSKKSSDELGDLRKVEHPAEGEAGKGPGADAEVDPPKGHKPAQDQTEHPPDPVEAAKEVVEVDPPSEQTRSPALGGEGSVQETIADDPPPPPKDDQPAKEIAKEAPLLKVDAPGDEQNKAVTKEPLTKEPLTKEPLTKEPVTKEPVTKEPTVEVEAPAGDPVKKRIAEEPPAEAIKKDGAGAEPTPEPVVEDTAKDKKLDGGQGEDVAAAQAEVEEPKKKAKPKAPKKLTPAPEEIAKPEVEDPNTLKPKPNPIEGAGRGLEPTDTPPGGGGKLPNQDATGGEGKAGSAQAGQQGSAAEGLAAEPTQQEEPAPVEEPPPKKEPPKKEAPKKEPKKEAPKKEAPKKEAPKTEPLDSDAQGVEGSSGAAKKGTSGGSAEAKVEETPKEPPAPEPTDENPPEPPADAEGSAGVGPGVTKGGSGEPPPDTSPAGMLKPDDRVDPANTGTEGVAGATNVDIKLSALPKFEQHRYFAMTAAIRREGGTFVEDRSLFLQLETHPGKEAITMLASIPPGREVVLPGPIGATIARRGLEFFRGPFPAAAPARTGAFKKTGDVKALLNMPDQESSLPEMKLAEYQAEMKRRLGLRLYQAATETDPSIALPPIAVQMLAEVKAQLESGAITIGEAEQQVSRFIERRYAYDLGFAESAQLAAIDFTQPDAAKRHFELIHQDPPPGKLGRGVCMQLNMLKLELLRSLGLPALMMTGLYAHAQELGPKDGHAWVGIPVPGKDKSKVRLVPSDSSVTPGDAGHSDAAAPFDLADLLKGLLNALVPEPEAPVEAEKKQTPGSPPPPPKKKKPVFFDPTPDDLIAVKNFLGHLLFSGANRSPDPDVAGAFLRQRMDDEELRAAFKPKSVQELQNVWWLQGERLEEIDTDPTELGRMMSAAKLSPAQQWAVRRVFGYPQPEE